MSVSGLGRILIVDDEQTVRDVLAEYFTERGYEVATAASGADALRGLPESRPDLVLLDVRMPGIDGVETLRRLRDVAPGVAVIMVTANDDVALAREMLKLGALDYVSKPFDFDYLERSVMAGLVHAGVRMPERPAAPEPWRAVVHAAFRLSRVMENGARASTGVRLEDAALRAARAGAGNAADAVAALAEMELLLSVAVELRDAAGSELSAVRTAVATARATLRGA